MCPSIWGNKLSFCGKKEGQFPKFGNLNPKGEELHVLLSGDGSQSPASHLHDSSFPCSLILAILHRFCSSSKPFFIGYDCNLKCHLDGNINVKSHAATWQAKLSKGHSDFTSDRAAAAFLNLKACLYESLPLWVRLGTIFVPITACKCMHMQSTYMCI